MSIDLAHSVDSSTQGERGGVASWQAPVGLAIIAAGLIWRAQSVAIDTRSEVLPSVIVQILVWALCLYSFSLRSRDSAIRLSDPGMWVMGWFTYYFILPSITWLDGTHFALENTSGAPLDTEAIIRVQYFHVVFMLVFVAAYHLVAPRFRLTPVTLDDLKSRFPSVIALVCLGLGPIAFEAVVRLMASGTLRPTTEYGDAWTDVTDGIAASRNIGGGDYLMTQVFAKLWFVPLMSLGVGYGLIYARLLMEKRWVLLAAFHLQFPLLLYLGTGTRSSVGMPILIALIVADYLYGALPWRYLLVVFALGIAFFNFYAFFRNYQTQELDTAVEQGIDQQNLAARSDSDHSENAGMLFKEGYCLGWADATGYDRGIDYYTESILTLLPLQLVPEKATWQSTATILSRDLLGRASTYSGVAGAIVCDGYVAGREPGVPILAAVLGLIMGLLVRILVRPERNQDGPLFWRVALLACFSAQTVVFVRNDLSTVLTQILFFVAIPSMLFMVLTRPNGTGWSLRIRLT